MVAGFQGFYEWPVNHYVYYIYYLIKFFYARDYSRAENG